jgi:5-methyltetrahydrofolate--homocysteine methyltransferase
VKGDVHDIGKNIVAVVLRCNNFEVVNMGVMVPASEILARAKLENADIIGLSGLITPSLEEMAHVAKEMQRDEHFRMLKIPLLIGGATTSRAHTAVKIAPGYREPVVHVLDASRAVGVVGHLKSPELKATFDDNNRREQEKARVDHRNKQSQRPLLTLEEARRRQPAIEWSPSSVYKPLFTGVKVDEDVPLEEIVPYIDWTPFFQMTRKQVSSRARA